MLKRSKLSLKNLNFSYKRRRKSKIPKAPIIISPSDSSGIFTTFPSNTPDYEKPQEKVSRPTRLRQRMNSIRLMESPLGQNIPQNTLFSP